MYAHANMSALRTAIPYIRAFEGRVFVVKLSGRLCEPGPALDNVVEQLSLLASLGIKLVVVHGGGDQLNSVSERMGLTPHFVAGRRITDADTLELAKMVFAGTINTNLVAAFRRFDIPAVGLTGVDAGLIAVVRRPVQHLSDPTSGQGREVDYGLVGNIVGARPELVEHLAARRFVPVIACLAADAGGQIYNVNADTVAARLAAALHAVKYILLTTVDGVMLDVNNSTTLQTHLDLEDLENLTKRGAISGGMLPKIEACIEALKAGVPRVHIVNGMAQDSVLAELFTNEGCGTLIVADRDKKPASHV